MRQGGGGTKKRSRQDKVGRPKSSTRAHKAGPTALSEVHLMEKMGLASAGSAPAHSFVILSKNALLPFANNPQFSRYLTVPNVEFVLMKESSPYRRTVVDNDFQRLGMADNIYGCV